jgi:hypothetical protein
MLALPALPRLLLATLVLLVGLLSTLVLLVGLLAALMLLIRLLLAAPLLLLARTGIVRLLAGFLIGIARIGHGFLLEGGSGTAPGPRGKRPEMKRVRPRNVQLCDTLSLI